MFNVGMSDDGGLFFSMYTILFSNCYNCCS